MGEIAIHVTPNDVESGEQLCDLLGKLERLTDAAARYRWYHEQGQTIPRHDAWRDLCHALDALGATKGPRNPRADIRTNNSIWWTEEQ